MKVRIVLSVLTAGAVMLGAGAAVSGGTCTTENELVDFDQSTGKLWAYPQGQPLATYMHTSQTRHLRADIGRFEPPDPCFEYSLLWNEAIRYDERFHQESGPVFEALIGLMTQSKCGARVTTPVGAGSPPPIVTFEPSSK
jgi:hypothetical protein